MSAATEHVRSATEPSPPAGSVTPASTLETKAQADDTVETASTVDANIPGRPSASIPPDTDEIVTSKKDEEWVEGHNGASGPSGEEGITEAPPLPEEALPPLPGEAAPPLPEEALPPLPAEEPPALPAEDDGWDPVWEQSVGAFYFYNRITGATQWDNPRVPEANTIPGNAAPPPGLAPEVTKAAAPARPAGGYDPAVHGDYDPTAWYAQPVMPEESSTAPLDPAAQYAATGAFNRFTGRWQASDLTPENFNDENKSKRQMNAFFDVDAAANSHDGRSLKAERSGKKLSKAELKKVKDKKIAKKKEKQRAWLLD